MTNGRFRIMLAHHRGPYRQSLVLALAVMVALFVFFPPFEFTPYRLQAEEKLEIVDVPPEIDIPPPPKEVPAPPVDITPAEPGEQTDDVEANVVSSWDDAPIPPPVRDTAAGPYVAFDRLPDPEYIAQPEYPALARQAGIEGTVYLKIRVGLDHRVHDAVVISSDVTPAMERAAVEAALECRYRPAMQGPVAVEVWVPMRIEFRLEPSR